LAGSLTIVHSSSQERGRFPPRPPHRWMALLGQQQAKADPPLMSKREESKYKINRRLGVNLWGRAKSPLNRREYGPGQHGQRRKKPSDYGTQLAAKQKLKGYYANIGERQFRRLYEEAVRRRGDTGENLIALLERRLDACIYRMKLAPTPFAARQIVNHGHVLVHGKRVNNASYPPSDGDTIVLLLILLNGFFAMAEIALVSARPARLQPMAANGNAGAEAALELKADPSRLLATVQIGITIIAVLLGSFGEATLGEDLQYYLEGYPGFLGHYAHAISMAIVVLGISYFSLILGELVPKRVAMIHPEGIAAALGRFMRGLARIGAPIEWLLSATSDLLLRLL